MEKNDRDMRIWVFGRGYPTKQNNMLGIFELEQAKMLARHSYEVYYPVAELLSLRQWRSFGIEINNVDGVHVIIFHIPLGRLVPKFVRGSLFNGLRNRICMHLVKKYGLPDIIHVHYPSAYPYGFFAKMQQKGVKIVGTEHWTKVQDKSLDLQQLKNLIEFAEHSDKICCVGDPLRRSIRELTGTVRDIEIVPNLVNDSFINMTVKEHTGFRFVAAGRMVPVKQFDRIAMAFISVFREDKNVSLTIAGMGSEHKKIVEIVKNAGMEDRIHLPGTVSREEMANLIASSDALVVFSKLETFCVPVIEAWACGKPVIATETTAIVDHPDKRLGIIVDSKDQSSLEQAFRLIYQKSQAYPHDWIRNYAKKHFSEDAVFQQLRSIYLSILK